MYLATSWPLTGLTFCGLASVDLALRPRPPLDFALAAAPLSFGTFRPHREQKIKTLSVDLPPPCSLQF